MYLALIALPFLGSLMVGVRGRSLGFTGAGVITTGCVGAAAVLAWLAVYEVVLSRSPVSVGVLDWVTIGSDGLILRWSFMFDDLSTVMCAVVLTVSSLVHLYSIDYMAGDPHGQRFMSLLSLFTAFMVLLVTGDSLAILFAGTSPHPAVTSRSLCQYHQSWALAG